MICNDVHIHLGNSGPWYPDFDPSTKVSGVIKMMNKYSVKRAVVFPNPLPGSKYPEANNYIITSVRKNPKRLIGFGRIDPRYGKEILPEIIRLANEGIVGIKLHPFVECFRPDHPYFFPVFKSLVKSGIKFVLTHSNAQGFSAADHWSIIAKKLPHLKIILAHLNEKCISLLEKFNNIFVDTSGSSSALVKKACDINIDHILFGSDYPYLQYQREIEKIMNINRPLKDKEKILRTNFENLFL